MMAESELLVQAWQIVQKHSANFISQIMFHTLRLNNLGTIFRVVESGHTVRARQTEECGRNGLK